MHDGVFAHCILRPASELAKHLSERIFYIQMQRYSVITRNTLEVKKVFFRFQSILVQSFIRLVGDNGRFISVAKVLQKFAPTVYKLLTESCLSPREGDNEDTEVGFTFVLATSSVGSKKRPIATNIPILAGLLQFLYVEERREVLHALKEKEAREHYYNMCTESQKDQVEKEQEELGNKDPKPVELPECGDNLIDNGKTFDLACDLRKHLLEMPCVASKKDRNTGKEVLPGEGFLAGSTDKHKFGKFLRYDWRDDEVLLRFSGAEEEDFLPLDQALHALATGGFATPLEEKSFFHTYGQMDLSDVSSQLRLPKCGKVGKRISAVHKLLEHIENNCTMFKVQGGTKDDALPSILENIYKMNEGRFEFAEYFDEPFVDLSKPRKSSDKSKEEDVVDGAFAQNIGTKFKAGHANAALHSLALQFNRACLHKAIALMPAGVVLYKPENFIKKPYGRGKHQVPEKHWACEGPLLKLLSEELVKTRVDEFSDVVEDAKLHCKKGKNGVNWQGKFISNLQGSKLFTSFCESQISSNYFELPKFEIF